jgi:hypothetical protein
MLPVSRGTPREFIRSQPAANGAIQTDPDLSRKENAVNPVNKR